MTLERLRNPMKVRISKLSRSKDVTRSMRQIHRLFRDRFQNETESLDPADFEPHAECTLFQGVRLEDMKRYLDESRLELSGPEAGKENGSGLRYQVYSVPKQYTGVMNALRDADYAAYHRIYLETPDGVVNRNIGEL